MAARHAPREVDRVVSEALVEAPDVGELDRHRERGSGADELAGEGDVQLVHLVVHLVDAIRGVGIAITEGIGGHGPHLRRDLAHPLEEATAASRHLRTDSSCRSAGDVLGKIAAALKFGEHAEDRHELAEVVTGGEAAGSEKLDEACLDGQLHLLVEIVDRDIRGHELLCLLAVAAQQCVGSAGDRLAHEREQLDNLAIDLGRYCVTHPRRLHTRSPRSGAVVSWESGGRDRSGRETSETRWQAMSELSWGRQYLMCRPDNFDVFYEINPWMHAEVKPDTEAAIGQFEGLVAALRAAGAELSFQPSVEGLPDLVFTANAGLVDRKRFVPAAFRHPERQGETPYDIAWFSEHDYEVLQLEPGVCHEGAGDALPFQAPPESSALDPSSLVLVSGHHFRSDIESHPMIASLLGIPVYSVKLVDERLYHFDLCFCPLDETHAIVAPLGLDRDGLATLGDLVREPLLLEDDEATAFVANSVVVGKNIVMPSCPPRVGRTLESWGFSIAVAPVGEFLKAGGGCRCLTLALDVDFSSGAAVETR